MRNQYRFLARIVIEAISPLNIGSGKKGIKTDSLVLRDVNGLPFIPGTTIAGLLRHSYTVERNEGETEKEYKKKLEYLREPLMGSQNLGSPLIITEAKMLDSDGTVLDGIDIQKRLNKNAFLDHFRELPVRQHAKIDHRGTAEKGGKFDEEIVLKGTRFCFEMEMLSDSNDDSEFKDFIKALNSETFRVGSGSRSGFGEIKIVREQCQYKSIDLTIPKQKDWYLKKSSSLCNPWDDAEEEFPFAKEDSLGWTNYELDLQPIDFMLFGSGLSSDKADMNYVRESFVDWDTLPAEVRDKEKVVLIPASSIKGALSHRLAFHYNKKAGVFADQMTKEELSSHVGKNNLAVKALFGSEGEKGADGKMKNKLRGNVLMSDIIQEEKDISSKVLNHVSIDRFTGGAIDGALFTEEVLFAKGKTFKLKLLVNKAAFQTEYVEQAFEKTLEDIVDGILPLGGGVNRGNGCFKGKIYKNGELIYANN